MRKLLFLLALGFAVPAYAGDLPAKAKPKLVNVVTTVPCTVLSCVNKFYVGGGLAGIGGNADIIGNGISGSVFAGGGIPFGDVGWMTWNGNFLLGIEVGAGWQFNTSNSVNGVNANETGYMAYQEFRVGGSLSSIYGNNAAPVTPPSGLTADIMTPYAAFGVEEHEFATGWRTGAGILFALPNSNIVLDIGYRYTNFGSATAGNITFPALNLVYANFDVPLN